MFVFCNYQTNLQITYRGGEANLQLPETSKPREDYKTKPDQKSNLQITNLQKTLPRMTNLKKPHKKKTNLQKTNLQNINLQKTNLQWVKD